MPGAARRPGTFAKSSTAMDSCTLELRFRPDRAQNADRVVQAGAGPSAGVGQLASGREHRSRRGGRTSTDAGSSAGPGGEEALALERLVRFRDGAGGDAEVLRQLPDRG